jgi:hypothetical protein
MDRRSDDSSGPRPTFHSASMPKGCGYQTAAIPTRSSVMPPARVDGVKVLPPSVIAWVPVTNLPE